MPNPLINVSNCVLHVAHKLYHIMSPFEMLSSDSSIILVYP